MGVPTICYGQNLQNDYAMKSISDVGGNYEVIMSGGCLSESQCTTLMHQDVERAREGVENIYGYDVSCPCAQNVLVDMAFSLG